nr:hypothetical protein [Tanacetum cinerariifolium]
MANTVKNRAEYIEEMERYPRLRTNVEAVEIARVLKHAQKRDMEKAIRLQIMMDRSHLGVHVMLIFVQKLKDVMLGVLQSGIRAIVIENKVETLTITTFLFLAIKVLRATASPECSSDSFGIVPIASPSLSLVHNDPYMKILQAFYAKELPIPPPNPITPPVILTSSPVLPPSPLFDP